LNEFCEQSLGLKSYQASRHNVNVWNADSQLEVLKYVFFTWEEKNATWIWTEHLWRLWSVKDTFCSCSCSCSRLQLKLNIEFLEHLGIMDHGACGMDKNSLCRAPTPGKRGVARLQFDFAHVRKVASEGKRSEHREVPCHKSCFQFQHICLRLPGCQWKCGCFMRLWTLNCFRFFVWSVKPTC
jgi:hypothetical protein